jgi:NAD(P)-dependent dehydrogenase (short-subunit alcohol dehydrogenase family)
MNPSEAPVYLVLGAAGGIGTALCRRLAARGSRLLLAGRSPEKLAALQAEVGGAGGGEAFTLDASKFDQVDAAGDRAVAAFGRLDGIVCLIGSIMLKAAHQTSQTDLQSVLEQNVHSAFAAVRTGGRLLRASGGSIVLTSSTAGRVGLPNHEAIAAAKAAVIGLAQSAAATYAPSIRVNAVAPGLTRTPMAKPLLASEMAEKASIAMHPLGRLGEADEIAAAIDFLLSPDAQWITGQVLGIDGGLSTVRPRVKA